MRDCGCEECRRRREQAEDEGWVDAITFALFWHEYVGAWPWEHAPSDEHPGDVDDDAFHDADDGYGADDVGGFDDGFWD